MNKDELKELIKIFCKKWDNTNGMWKNEFYPSISTGYSEFKIKASYGNSGNRIQLPRYPWIAFLKDNFKVSDGIYPSIVYKYDENKLDVLIGISNDNEPSNINDTILEKIRSNNLHKKFNINELDEVVQYVDNILKKFNTMLISNNATINNYNQQINIKNIILYGSPGVGKTHNINKLISLIESEKSEKKIFEIIKNNEHHSSIDVSNLKERVKFITFHQSFGYEDFIEGFRPNEEGKITLVDGIFKEICIEADKDRDNIYYLVIDEINRGNISKIFGELITLIEEDKRDTLEVILPYSKKPFKIPSNLYIIGTMNSTDKSIALIDIALRRRFTFLKMKPKAELIGYQPAKEIFEKLNKQIEEDLGEDYQLGHSYFMKIQDEDDLAFVLEYKIIPLLEEYYYGDDRLKEVINI